MILRKSEDMVLWNMKSSSKEDYYHRSILGKNQIRCQSTGNNDIKVSSILPSSMASRIPL